MPHIEFDDLGMEEEQLKRADFERHHIEAAAAGAERNKREDIYIEFADPWKKAEALSLVDKEIEARNPLFEYFLYHGSDPKREWEGIKVSFSKTVPGRRQKLVQLFREHDIIPTESYDVIGGKPADERPDMPKAA